MIAFRFRIERDMEKITPTDLRKQAEELIRDGKMPTLEQLLAVVAETREKYTAKILEARHVRRGWPVSHHHRAGRGDQAD